MVTKKESEAVENGHDLSQDKDNDWDSDADGSQSEADSENESSRQGEIIYEDVQLEELSHPLLRSALEDANNELWLVRLPRHSALRAGIEGTEVHVAEALTEESPSTHDRRAGVAKGNYVYREQAMVDNDMRPVFVATDEAGRPAMRVGRPFARSISITFDVSLNSLTANKQPPRRYPSTPKGQKRRYFPIGSSKGNTGRPPAVLSSAISKSMHSPRRESKQRL